MLKKKHNMCFGPEINALLMNQNSAVMQRKQQAILRWK